MREVGQDEFVDPHPDVIANPPRGGAEEAGFLAFVKLDFTKLAEPVGKLVAVQKRGMHRVNDGVQHLNPVAVKSHYVGRHHHIRQLKGVVHRKRRQRFGRAAVRKDQALVLAHRIGAEAFAPPDFFGRRRAFGFARNFEYGAVYVKQPAVITTADSPRFAVAEFQRGAPVRAFFMHQPDAPAEVAEQYQFLPQDADQFGPLAQFAGDKYRVPVTPQVLAANRARPDFGQLAIRFALPGLMIAVERHEGGVGGGVRHGQVCPVGLCFGQPTQTISPSTLVG